jgi:hypothetical protein
MENEQLKTNMKHAVIAPEGGSLIKSDPGAEYRSYLDF